MRKYGYLLIVTVLLLESCSTTHPRPSWTSGTLPQNPSFRDCLVGMGMAVVTRDWEGDARRADAAAFSEIARQIQVQLKEELITESEYWSRMNTASGKTEDRSYDRLTIKSSQGVEFTLEGAHVVERFYDEKARVHYSLAVLNKPRTAKRLAGESRHLFRDADQMAREGLAMVDRGETVPGIKKLIVATDKYEDACRKRTIASILSNAPSEPAKSGNPLFKLQDVIDRVAIQCVSGDNQQARTGVSLPRPVVVRAVCGKGNPVPLMPLAISVQGRDGRTEGFPLTDGKGMAVISVPEISRTGVSRNAIRIAPAWNEIVRAALNGVPASWMDRIGKAKAIQVTYFLRTENITSVTVVSPAGFSLEDGSGRIGESIVVQPLMGSLKAAGFVVRQAERCASNCSLQDQAARYRTKTDLLIVIDGSLSLSDWRGNMPLYRARLTLTCYDCVRGDIIGSEEGQAIGGAPDRRRSAERALAAVADEYIPGFVRGIRDKLP